MTEVNAEKLYEYLKENNILSDEEIRMIRVCTSEVTGYSPTDKPLVFKKMDSIIENSQNLAWIIHSINSRIIKIKTEYKKLRDPNYVVLVRQGRPSTAAIESELRFKDENLYSMEETMDILNNIVEYLNHIQVSMDRYLYMLRDKLKYQ